MQCPICAYEHDSEDVLTIHIEESHFGEQALSASPSQAPGYSQSELDSALAHQLQQEEERHPKNVEQEQAVVKSVFQPTEL